MSGSPPPYVELHCHSSFSFLDGTSDPSELAATAANLGYPALALTDHDGLWGTMEFAQACKGFGIHPITGAEVTVTARPQFHLTLLVEDAAGYRNLCRILTKAHAGTREGAQRTAGQPSVALEEVERHAEGLVCLSGCAGEGALAGRWERGELGEAERLARRLRAAFGRDRLRVELQRPYWRRDLARNRWLAALAERIGVPCVATGDVHCHDRRRARLQDAFVAVRLGATLEESEPLRRGNSVSVLAAAAEMAERFREHPEAVRESAKISERLRFDLTSELGYRYPGAEDPGADRQLAELCRELLERRYAAPRKDEARARLEEELRIIRALRLSGFFLLHRDMLELAREVAVEVRGPESSRSVLPPGRGRGSSVSSIVCYLSGLSHVDPVEAGLFAGRFLNEEVSAVPDIDLDFPRDIREKLIPRVHQRYGTDRSALVAAFPTYRPKGVIRDLGKALGLPPGEIERVARIADYHGGPEALERDVATALGNERAGSCAGAAWSRSAPRRSGCPPRLPAPRRDGALDRRGQQLVAFIVSDHALTSARHPAAVRLRAVAAQNPAAVHFPRLSSARRARQDGPARARSARRGGAGLARQSISGPSFFRPSLPQSQRACNRANLGLILFGL